MTLNTNSAAVSWNVVGLGTDWVNTSSVYAACAFFVASGATGASVRGCHVSNMAGAGVLVATATDDVKVIDNVFTGVGSGVITPVTGQYSGGVVLNCDGMTNVVIRGNTVKGFAQGINGGTITGLTISGNSISAAGQHGIYYGAIVNGVVTGNVIDGTGLEGMKFQLTDHGALDTDTLVISGNVLRNIGSHGIHLALATGTNVARNAVIGNNVINHTTAGNGDDILVEWGIGVTVHDNIGTGAGIGFRALHTSGLKLHHNRHVSPGGTGIYLSDVTDSDASHNRIINPASALTANNKYGIAVFGSTSADIRFTGNKVTDANAKMQYGVYVVAGDLTTMEFTDNRASGATDNGFRSTTTTTVLSWTNNVLTGTSGAFYNTPTNVNLTTAPNTQATANMLVGTAYDPVISTAGTATVAAGILNITKVRLLSGGVVTNLVFQVATAGTGLTSGQCFMGVYDSTGALIGTTVDQAAGSYASTGVKTVALVTPTASLAVGAEIFVAWFWNGTTGPQLRGISGTGQGNIGVTATASYRFSSGGSGYTTALPGTCPAKAASATAAWVGVS